MSKHYNPFKIQTVLDDLERGEKIFRSFVLDKERIQEQNNIYDSQLKLNDQKFDYLSEELEKKSTKLVELERIFEQSFNYQKENQKLLKLKELKEDSIFGLHDFVLDENFKARKKMNEYELKIKEQLEKGRTLFQEMFKVFNNQSNTLKRLSLFSAKVMRENKAFRERNLELQKKVNDKSQLVFELKKQLSEKENQYEEELHRIKMDNEEKVLQLSSKINTRNSHQVSVYKKKLIQMKLEYDKLSRQLKNKKKKY